MESNQIPDQPENKENLVADFHDEVRQIQLEGYALTVKKARNALFWAAGLILLGEFIGLGRSGQAPDPISIGIIVFIVGIFIALALWTKKKPYTAIICGIIAFCLYLALNVVAFAYLEGSDGILKSIFSGIFIKVFILIALIRPLKDAKELQQSKENIPLP